MSSFEGPPVQVHIGKNKQIIYCFNFITYNKLKVCFKSVFQAGRIGQLENYTKMIPHYVKIIKT